MTTIKLSEKQARTLRSFVTIGAFEESTRFSVKSSELRALVAKGLVFNEDKRYSLTDEGRAWLMADKEARTELEELKRVTEKRDQMVRDLILNLEAMFREDVAFAAMFSSQGFGARKHLFKPGNEAYTEDQLSGAVHSFADKLERMAIVIHHERQNQKIQARADAERRDIQAAGLIDHVGAAKLLGISLDEFRRAFELHYVKPVRTKWTGVDAEVYFGKGYYDPASLTLTDAQRDELYRATTLNKWQAADRLGIDPRQFDKLRKGRINPAGSYVSNSGYPGNLYSIKDIDSLRPFIKKA